jgi:hypothetical protein
MDAAPSSARGVSEELAPVPRVAVTPPEYRFLMALFFLASKAATSRWVFLHLAMELMINEEPIASERGDCSSKGYELEWTSMYCAQ